MFCISNNSKFKCIKLSGLFKIFYGMIGSAMKKVFIFLFFLFSSMSAFSQEMLTTIPQVQQWVEFGGGIKYKTITITYSNGLNERQKRLFNRFKKELKELGICLSEKPSNVSVNLLFNLAYVDIEGEENAYKIQLDKTTSITVSSYESLVFATRTLLQLFSQKKYKEFFPRGILVDYPSYEKRMLLIDVARKFFTIEELKDFIRAMAWVKMNELHLHLSDNSWGGYSAYRLESEKYPELTAKDGHYSWDEIEDLQKFAMSYGITITPEIDSPGHSLAFTRIRPDLKSAWLSPDYLDITNEDTYLFMEGILHEVIPHFDAPDFHLGTDEYRINSIRNDSLKIHIGETFKNYINHLNKVVRGYGKTTRIWSGFEHMPGNIMIDKNIIIDMWETSDAMDKSSKGYKIINSSHYYTYIVPGAPYYGVDDKFVYEKWTPEIFSDLGEQNLDKYSLGLLGSKMHIWSDFGPTGYSIEEIARLAIPSMMVFSEKMWGTKAYDSFDDFKRTLNKLMRIPQTKLLNRNFSDEKTVYTSNISFDLNDIALMPINSKKKDIEYPWKLELTLRRKNKSIGNEVLLSSRLATLYTDLEYTFEYRKGKKKIEEKKRGFAIVRANQTEGDTPLKSHRPAVIVFDYELPLNQTVMVTLRGEKGKTSMYVDGALIGSENVQMICPLEFIGSEKETVFNGYVDKIEIKELVTTPHKLN